MYGQGGGSTFDDLLSQGYTEDEIKSILALGGMQDEGSALGRAEERAAGKAQFRGAQGRQVGELYVAANPLEHLATVLRSYMGQKEMKGVQQQQQELLRKQQEARSQFLRNRTGAPLPMAGGGAIPGGYTGGVV